MVGPLLVKKAEWQLVSAEDLSCVDNGLGDLQGLTCQRSALLLQRQLPQRKTMEAQRPEVTFECFLLFWLPPLVTFDLPLVLYTISSCP